MAWLAVDENGGEHLYNVKPIRRNNEFDYDESYYDSWYIKLLKGSIKKLIGKELTWDDEPVEI